MRIIYSLFLLVAVISFPCRGVTAPSTSGVEGNFSNGSQITISGFGFGTKPTATPLVWDTFEDGSVGTLIQNQTATVGDWDAGSGSDRPVYSSTQARTGSQSSYHPFRSGDANNASLAKNGSFPSFYLDFWARITPLDNVSRNYKIWRAYGDYSGNDDNMQFDYVWYCNGQSMTMYSYPCETNANDWKGRPMQQNQWMHFQVYFKESDPSIANGLVRQYIDGVITTNTTTRITRCNSNHLNEMRVGHYWATDAVSPCPSNSGADVYIDDVYFDSSMAHVEIGNAPTYASSTHKEVLIPTSWTDTSITATFNTGTFATNDTVYLYVIDANGDVNSFGTELTIGGSSAADTTPPALSLLAPSGTLAAGTTSTALSFVTDGPALCRYSNTAGVDYDAMTNNFSTSLYQSHSTTVSGLENGESYNYYVRCMDGSGNVNTTDATISFSVASSAGPAGVLSWQYDNYVANREEGRIPITIVRTGGSTGTVTAQWSSNGQTALHNVDYYGNDSVTVTFGDGVTSVPINTYGSGEDGIEMIDNGATVDRYFQMILSNPTGGATLGSTLATVTINGQPEASNRMKISTGATMRIGAGSTPITVQ